MRINYIKKVEKMMASVLIGSYVFFDASAVLMDREDVAGSGDEGEMAQDALKAIQLNDVEV